MATENDVKIVGSVSVEQVQSVLKGGLKMAEALAHLTGKTGVEATLQKLETLADNQMALQVIVLLINSVETGNTEQVLKLVKSI